MNRRSWYLGGSVLHLRATFLALTPLLATLQAHFGLDYAQTGLLTTLPLLVFASVSPFVGDLASRWGTARLFAFAMGAIGIGVATRSYTGITGLFFGTVCLALGIAIGNVLLPAVVKEWYPGREGKATGIFVALMNGGNALWTAAIVPVSWWTGWQLALGWWAIPSFLLAFIWYRQSTRQKQPPGMRIAVRKLFAIRTAWWVSLFIGLQSFVFFSVVAWLPYWVVDKGYGAADAGAMAFLFQLVGLPAALLAPILATGSFRQGITVGTCALYIVGTICLFASQSWWPMVLAIVLIGVAAGATFSLCMLAFPLRSGSLAIAARLTGVGQAIGYLLAATGPVSMGYLYSLTFRWNTVLPVFIGAAVLMSICGWLAMGPGRIEPADLDMNRQNQM